jgi:hypothetical protein
MKKLKNTSRTRLLFSCLIFTFMVGPLSAGEKRKLDDHEEYGRQLFDGSVRFMNGGPACVSCHAVENSNVIPGGILAKDLTDVYDRMGEGLSAWLGAPPFPAMVSSYKNNPLTEKERTALAAFFKYTNEEKGLHAQQDGFMIMLIGGAGGVIVIFILVSLLWVNRKRKMVKQDIFSRQSRAFDAKF